MNKYRSCTKSTLRSFQFLCHVSINRTFQHMFGKLAQNTFLEYFQVLSVPAVITYDYT